MTSFFLLYAGCAYNYCLNSEYFIRCAYKC